MGMKFLGIKALKKELSEGSLKQADLFGYWLASTIVIQLALLPATNEPTLWEYLYWIASAVLAVVMLRRCYLANGGAAGAKFSDKFISISWVMTVRGLLMIFIPLAIVGFVVATLAGFTLGLDGEGVDALVENTLLVPGIVFELWVWLRTAAHIREVS